MLDLTLAQGSKIVGDGFFFVKADLAGVGAHESFIEDAAGKLIEVFFFQCAEHARADLGGVGDGVELEAALLALFAKFFSEGCQGCSGRRDGNPSALMGIMIGEEGRRCHIGVRGRSYLG